MRYELIKGDYGSPRWTAELADCSMPMTFDQYSRCSFGCLYCFAAYRKAVGNAKANFASSEIRSVSVARIKKIFTEPGYSQFTEYVQQRRVLQWGGMADPFCPLEREFGVGLELLRFFAEQEYPICFSTKGTWWTKDARYRELFKRRKNWNVKFSIITTDEGKRKQVERGCPSTKARFRAMARVASWAGGGVTLRLRPFMLGISNPGHVELIQRAADAGATALSTEFFCLEQRSPWLRQHLKLLNILSGFKVMDFYRRYSVMSGYLRLNRNVKRPFVDQMEEACDKYGLRFYVSDAHFKERCANGSCCGLPESWNYSRGQWCHALMIAKATGRVGWGDLSDSISHLRGVRYIHATGFNNGNDLRRAKFQGVDLAGYMRYLWNHPTEGQSPYLLFEGILKPIKVDKKGDLIYVYDKTRA